MGLRVIVFIILSVPAFSQKPALDTTVFNDWPMTGFAKISNDGKYVYYEVVHYSYNEIGWKENVIQSAASNWKKTFSNVSSDVRFSDDSKRVVFILSGDSLAILKLGTGQIDYIPRVEQYHLVHHYLVYALKGSSRVLKIKDMNTDNELSFEHISGFELYEPMDALLLCCEEGKKLIWYNLEKNKGIRFWEGDEAGGFRLDKASGAIAFIAGKAGQKKLWLYHAGEQKARLLKGQMKGEDVPGAMHSSLNINSVYGFSPGGTELYFTALPLETTYSKNKETGATVSVWSYSDINLKSQVVKPRRMEYVFAVNVKTGKTVLVAGRNEKIYSLSEAYALVWRFSGTGDADEADWNPYSQQQLCLKFLKDTTPVILPVEHVGISKTGKYLLYFDEGNYYSYEPNTGKTVNITIFTPEGEFNHFYNHLANWIENDRSVILYANRDIWKLDPSGKRKPVNITNGYGARNNIIFYPLEFDFRKGKEVVMTAFNTASKENGFYKLNWESGKDPQKIIMGDVVYYSPHPQVENGFDAKPVKASGSREWLVKKMSERESPNWLLTRDFRTYDTVSSVYPEKRFNWLTTELFSWQSLDGDSLSGILYKPEDFDPRKKYPILFYYYEQFSDNLHAYLDPGPSRGPINIPWYVSHGYLVFFPDILYKNGETGRNAYSAVVSAAKLMARQSYVDSTKMGIQGHSFGGYQTNFIVTHTGLFRAACSASGMSDIVSFSGGVGAMGTSQHPMASTGQVRLNKKLWEDQDRYIRNSPVFYLKNVTTPLLLMHTTADKAVPFGQGLEMFNGLRQLQKKVWLLIYDGEDHVVRKKANYADYTARVMQFFDFYLKDGPMPKWMHAQ